jgi:hypothetical protein
VLRLVFCRFRISAFMCFEERIEFVVQLSKARDQLLVRPVIVLTNVDVHFFGNDGSDDLQIGVRLLLAHTLDHGWPVRSEIVL